MGFVVLQQQVRQIFVAAVIPLQSLLQVVIVLSLQNRACLVADQQSGVLGLLGL